jgi:hypothetical protein
MNRKFTVHESNAAGGGAVYGLGFIGAIIYHFQHADTFLQYVTGFFESLVWPAYVVYRILELFNM